MTSLIDFSDPHDAAAPRLRHAFGAPRRVLAAYAHDELHGLLEAAEQAARAGAWVLGWVAYEAAPAFDAALTTHPPEAGWPLAWFGVHDAPLSWPQAPPEEDARAEWSAAMARAQFDAAHGRVQQDIAQGRYYQVNLTAPLHGRLAGSPRALFAQLQRAQPGGYAAYVDAGAGQRVLSVSPELFFDWRAGADGEGELLTRPMKGTAARGASAQEDQALRAQLAASAKERAENVMIVDLLRNDVSRVAQPHSVRVSRLFHTEALASVWQMTSDVRATTRTGTRLAELFAALFPCGSVTGAPKREAMRAIRALESGPRGVYCGALGLLRPDPARGAGAIAATFNVPIRTLLQDGAALRCGIGSGLVWGAQADAEWREWEAKRRFVLRASEPFEILETLGLAQGSYRHLDAHLARMRASAAYFGHPWDDAALARALDALARAHADGAWRVRLLLDARGRYGAEAAPLVPTPTPVRLALATRPFPDAHGEFTRHKTTRRAQYAAFAPTPGSGVFDTLLYNDAGELTETTFGSIAAYVDGCWITPALSCGLLPGVGRARLLEQGRLREGVLRLADLPRVQDWAFINSLRGWLPARLQPPTAAP